MGNDLFYHSLDEKGSSLLTSYEINMRANAVRPYKSKFIIASISAEMLYRLRRRDLRGNQPWFPRMPLPSLTANKNKQKTN